MRLPTPLKRLLRPAVFVARHGWRRVHGWIRPAKSWDGKHHPIFARFPPWSGSCDGRFSYDWLGSKTDPKFRQQFRADPAGPCEKSWPTPYAPYFEWILLLEAAAAGHERGQFTMFELGAGFGPWIVAGGVALGKLGETPFHLTGVDMVPQHLKWMHEHFRNNGIDPSQHDLRHAAMFTGTDTVEYVPETDGAWDYGQEARPVGASPNAGAVQVPALKLSELLQAHEHVDLIHLDIQGAERQVLPECREELTSRVARAVVETHSRATHRELVTLFNDLGWRMRYVFDFARRAQTEFGDIQFLGGFIAAENPALVPGNPTEQRP